MIWYFDLGRGRIFFEDVFLSPPYLRNFTNSYISSIKNYNDDYTYIWKNNLRYYLGLRHDYIIENHLLKENYLYYDYKSNYFISVFDNLPYKSDTGFSKSMQVYVPVSYEFKKGLITTHDNDECRINPSKYYIELFCKDLYGQWWEESIKRIIKIKSKHIKTN
ncbi:hypothetical protein BPT24_076 [Tenacibaculum phage pT24]|uniref:Uncharacterized protein n=1 Tax=Tenacibaculum phage pT24 TaxID=1880590 RepID=A0A1B4XWM2_9CAUD|nr:hypothetical protein HYP10_gp076 [Tenacibaculum phage pT24]BAV39199.1 hypothetical protein BPT24_076 [Tenacibaculum phage pT24]